MDEIKGKIKLQFGNVTTKRIITPNDFVSHMIEHIAWRMGLQIDLNWPNENWRELGQCLGEKISEFSKHEIQSSALGMIDDGSAEVSIICNGSGLQIDAYDGVDLDYFFKCRCEQLSSGAPLIELLEGLAAGVNCRFEITMCNFEDPHHLWEGAFRAIGIALSKIYTPLHSHGWLIIEAQNKAGRNWTTEKPQRELTICELNLNRALVMRGTAETGVSIGVDFTQSVGNHFMIEASESISGALVNIEELLASFASGLGATLQVSLKSLKLSSSHVVMEDIGLVLGRALLEIIKLRMEQTGVNGAGSNLQEPEDKAAKNVKVGISIEGRKFWRIVPRYLDYRQLRKQFLIGADVLGGLRSEDLDDFVDGLSGGLCASIVIHIQTCENPDLTWQQVFRELGVALSEAFAANPYRRGVPPGVKATLS